MFITDAILNGLPPHIAQIIAGHRDINVTIGYKAVYPDEAIQAHLAFLARRRALRPSEEYRTPTDEEWQEFLGHFERRKVSIGTCGRAFGTPCIHEHACIRCSMLWPDPAQRDPPRRDPRQPAPPASPKPNAKAGSAKSKASRSASPAPRTSSPRSTAAPPAAPRRPRHALARLPPRANPDGRANGPSCRPTGQPGLIKFREYGFRPDFCEAADPESKGIVENLVGYAKTDLMIPGSTGPAASRSPTCGGQHRGRGVVCRGQRRDALGDLRGAGRAAGHRAGAAGPAALAAGRASAGW